METKQLIPELRFPLFEGNWLINRTTIKIISGNNYPLSSYSSSGNLLIQGLNIYPGKLSLKNPIFITDSYNEIEHIILKDGDILLGLNRPIINKSLKVCRFNGDQAFLYQRAGVLKFRTENLNKTYWYQYLRSEGFLRKMSVELVGSDQPYIKSNLFNITQAYIPLLPEQQKIASFLTSVDNRISMLDKKKQAMEQYKKGVMQKLFNQEIRFRDEHGNNYSDWEEKKFKTLYEFKTTNSFSRDMLNYENGTVKNIHYGDIHIKFKTLFDIANERVPFINSKINLDKISEYCYLKEGDIIIADASEDYADIGKAIEIFNLNNTKVLAGLHTFLARRIYTDLAIGYVSSLLKSHKMRLQIMKIAQGTKVLGLSNKRYGEMKLPLPTLQEQEKIANFLSSIDTKIEHTNTQIEKSKEFKKGLLQKMFV